jgi:acetyltransferase
MTDAQSGTRAPAARRASGGGPLDVFFGPQTVAVFGASQTPGSVGRAVMANLLRSPFGGAVYPISPKWATAHGIRAYPSLAAVPAPVELAILAVPAAAAPGALEECAEAGVKGAVLMSDAFREGDPARADLARWLRERARRGPMRVLGPNSMGVACARTGFNATFAPATIPPGRVGFVSQSGSVLTGLTSGGLARGAGCSAFVSLGSMIDVGWADCIKHLGGDPQTDRIAIYVESIGDLQAFVDAVRDVTAEKPVIAVRGGRTAAGARAAAVHSGSHPGGDGVVEEALRRAGVIRADSLDEMFRMAEILGAQPAPRGRRLTILTNAGGPAVLATDALAAEGGS